MDRDVLEIVAFMFLFVALDVAALRFGYDSRRWAREMPFGSDAVLTLPRLPTHRHRFRVVANAQRWTPARAASTAIQPLAPQTRRLPILRDALSYHRFDLAAAGK